MTKKDLNILLVMKILKKLGLYVYFYKLVYIEKNYVSKYVSFLIKDDKLLKNLMKFGKKLKVSSRKNLIVNHYIMKNSKS